MSPGCVLLLEDHPLQHLTLLAGLRERFGRELVRGCHTAPEALDAVTRRGPYRALIADWMLDEGDASDVVRAFRERNPHAHVVVYTAHIDQRPVALRAGADVVYDKAVKRVSALLDEVHERVGGARATTPEPGA
jgi:DNA-binding NarL/FixJ family response regulator